MTELTRKRAEKIVNNDPMVPITVEEEMCFAKGYLQGHADATKEEREKASILIKTLDGETYKKTGCWCPTKDDSRHSLCLAFQYALKEFISAYEKEMKDEKI